MSINIVFRLGFHAIASAWKISHASIIKWMKPFGDQVEENKK
jgi:transposase-like protein